jgi:hypothetical protein
MTTVHMIKVTGKFILAFNELNTMPRRHMGEFLTLAVDGSE